MKKMMIRGDENYNYNCENNIDEANDDGNYNGDLDDYDDVIQSLIRDYATNRVEVHLLCGGK